ncbi:MAG: hypothetical protein GWP08_19885, partial [Nitrospiraceae bacterium]|nr:hypothetical protein [Nitrospiraceae bacterium]
MKSPPPESGNSAPLERRSSGPPPVPKTESTDFSSLMEGGVETRGTKAPPPVTDFRSLKSQAFTARKRLIKRTATDWIIEVFTPVMIFVMVYAIIFFLLDVRHVYLGLHESADRIALAYDGTLRMVAFFFVVGVVALNRLIARDGKNESIIYIFGLALAIGIFTFTTTEQMGSVAHNFMNSPGLATLFNMFLVAFVWWGTNRLTHECCVDDDPTAGEIGILTGTARRLQNVVRKASQPPAAKKARKQEPMILSNEFQPFDPSAPKKKKKPAAPPALAKATARLSKRHPGISIFYTSIPVMFAFAIGQRVLANGEPDRLLKAHYFIAAYTVSALALLMLSSLGGLRQ